MTLLKDITLTRGTSFQTVVLNWFGYGTHRHPLTQIKEMFYLSNLFNGKTLQFEPVIVQNITLCQHTKNKMTSSW